MTNECKPFTTKEALSAIEAIGKGLDHYGVGKEIGRTQSSIAYLVSQRFKLSVSQIKKLIRSGKTPQEVLAATAFNEQTERKPALIQKTTLRVLIRDIVKEELTAVVVERAEAKKRFFG